MLKRIGIVVLILFISGCQPVKILPAPSGSARANNCTVSDNLAKTWLRIGPTREQACGAAMQACKAAKSKKCIVLTDFE